jgi:hypothetical protein
MIYIPLYKDRDKLNVCNRRCMCVEHAVWRAFVGVLYFVASERMKVPQLHFRGYCFKQIS